MPIKSGTLDHVQAAYAEAIAEAVKSVVGNSYSNSVMYILNGLVNSSSHPTYNLSAGSVFFNGEVYLVDAVNFTVTGSNIAVCSIVTTQFIGTNADGVQFTDGVTRNVHDIRKVAISAALGGSGISNYVDGQRINSNRPDANIIAGTGIGVSGSYPNITVTNTAPAQPSPVLAYRKVFLGDLNTNPTDGYTTLLAGSNNGLSAYHHVFPAAFTGNILPVLQIGNQGHVDYGGFSDNNGCYVQLGFFDTTQMYFAIGTYDTSKTQALDLFYHILRTP